MKVKSLSRVQLLATPWTAAYQAPPLMGFSRQEYWSGVPLPSPNPCAVRGITQGGFQHPWSRGLTGPAAGAATPDGAAGASGARARERESAGPQSCPALCHPTDCSPPGSSAHGILQARVLERVAIAFSRGSSRPRNQTWVSCIVGRFFTSLATRETPHRSDTKCSVELRFREEK